MKLSQCTPYSPAAQHSENGASEPPCAEERAPGTLRAASPLLLQDESSAWMLKILTASELYLKYQAKAGFTPM